MTANTREEDFRASKEASNGVVKKIDDAAEVVKKEVHFRRHESLRGVDLLWLLLVRSTDFNPCCTSTYTFDREIPIDRLRKAIKRQCEVFPKYRRRLAHRDKLWRAPTFEDDPEFSIDRHIEEVELPEPAGPAELNAFVSEWISRGWDENKPLWNVALIRRYRDGTNARSAMVSRGHHSTSDGQGFIMSTLYITNFGAEMQKLLDNGANKLRKARLGQLEPAEFSPLFRPWTSAWNRPSTKPFIQAALFLIYWGSASIDLVQRILWSAIHLVYALWFFLTTFWRIELVVPTQSGPRERVFCLSDTVPLSDVKTIQKAFSGNRPGKSPRGILGHVTVNDVLCSIMADVISGAIARKPKKGWFAQLKWLYGKMLPMPVAFFVPISVRSIGQMDMRNLSTGSLAYLGHLPQEKPTVHQIHKHIHKSKQSLRVLKRSLLPELAFYWLQFTGMIPIIFYPIWGGGIWQSKAMLNFKDVVMHQVISFMPAILTNIPGPPKATELEGAKTISWSALPPNGGRGTLAIGVITYDSTVAIAVSVDKAPGFENVANEMCEDFKQRFSLYLDAAQSTLDESRQ